MDKLEAESMALNERAAELREELDGDLTPTEVGIVCDHLSAVLRLKRIVDRRIVANETVADLSIKMAGWGFTPEVSRSKEVNMKVSASLTDMLMQRKKNEQG